MTGLADFAEPSQDGSTDANTVRLKVMNVEYTDGGGNLVVHVFGRDSDGAFRHIEVVGHEPSLFIREDEYDASVENHYAVSRTEPGYTSLEGEKLRRVYTYTPDHVSTVRDVFTDTWEADLFYTSRFLIDTEVYDGMKIDMSAATRFDWIKGEARVTVNAIEPCDPPSVDPRHIIVDIEVASETDEFPDPRKAEWPVSTIVAYDSYDEEYVGWMLFHPDHGDVAAEDGTELDELRVFADESEMLSDFSEWVAEQRPDLMSGWYSDDFDYPYLINRMRNLNTWAYQQWSPLGEVWVSKRFNDPVVKGVSVFDMLEAYKKTQIHKLESKALTDVAHNEVGAEKIDIELSHTDMWKQQPVTFLKYNKRDVELVKKIEESQNIIELFEHLRHVTGAQFDDCHANINMIDMLMLREANASGIQLPTAEKPERDWYYGAYVFQPTAGLHEHVVYPDYASLYPNMMYQCNMSPETLIGSEAELEESPYTEDDCVWSYYDPRPPSVKKESDPQMEKLYFLKPSVQEGFVRRVVGKILTLTDRYEGKLYEAVKRVRNSVYGVMGDSKSFGRGFRLFDDRLAESITLGSRLMLQEGASEYTDALERLGHEGVVVGGDTDSFMTAITSASTDSEAIEAAEEAAMWLNEQWMDTFVLETFGVTESAMELEMESYSPRCFFPAKKGHTSGGMGTKKRYVTQITWEDGERLDEPKMNVKGFEYVRSDVAKVTKEAQTVAFNAMMNKDLEDAREEIYEWIEAKVEEIRSGDVDWNTIGIPFGIGQEVSSYGSEARRPQPQYRGAKYANTYIYQNEGAISEGDKPLYFYVETVESPYPSVYHADTAEDGDPVDAIAVHDANDIPDAITIDAKVMIEKTLKMPMERIFRTMQWGEFETVWSKGQSNLEDFM